jgi:hypothetical protein
MTKIITHKKTKDEEIVRTMIGPVTIRTRTAVVECNQRTPDGKVIKQVFTDVHGEKHILTKLGEKKKIELLDMRR